jgi:hypothetical protein
MDNEWCRFIKKDMQYNHLMISVNINQITTINKILSYRQIK